MKLVNKIDLKSLTIEDILENEGWKNTKYDVIIDTQGSELNVLKGINKSTFNNIDKLIVEISQKEYYKNGVQFNELNKFIIDNDFEIKTPKNKIKNHGDVSYKNKSIHFI